MSWHHPPARHRVAAAILQIQVLQVLKAWLEGRLLSGGPQLGRCSYFAELEV